MKQCKHLATSDISASASISTSPPPTTSTTSPNTTTVGMTATLPRLLTSITVAVSIAMAIALTPTTMLVEGRPQAVTGPIREESAATLLSCMEWPNSPECLNASLPTGSPLELLQRNASWPPLDNLLEMDLEMDPDNNWPLERVVSTIVPVFFGIIGLAGLLGNALVILVVVANQQMRSTTNLLIINLAISDILFVIFCVPFTATDYVLPTWPFGSVLCKFVQYMIVVTCHCSVYTLVLMSFDRFLAVVHPVSSISLRTERNALLAILLAWVLIVTSAIPVALCHTVRIYKYRGSDYTACVFNSEEDTWSLVGFQVSFFLSSYVAPLTLISFLYMGMLARLWKTAPGCKPSAESRKGKRRVTRMVVVVVLAFAICWLPIHVILLLKALGYYGSTETTVIIQIISHVLAYTNSCINPILYAFLSDNFRKAFRKIVWCGSTPLIVTNQQITKTTRTTGNGTSNIDML